MANFSDTSLIKDLVVIDLPHADMVKGSDWDWKDQHFFPAENCDRQLLIGFGRDLDSVPIAIKEAATDNPNQYNDKRILIARGADAYKHLLRAASGMLDKRTGEKQTIEEVRSNWEKFLRTDTQQRKAKFGKIVDAFVSDSKAIRAQVFCNHAAGFYIKPTSSEPAVAARNMHRPKRDDEALIICEKDGITGSTFKVFDNCVNTLTITHPDPQKCDAYAAHLRNLDYKSNVEMISFEDLGEEAPRFQYVFNCQPMDNGDGDRAMIDIWKKNTRPGAILINLKGNPQDRNTTSEVWKQAGLNNVVFVEALQEQKKRDEAHNKEMLALAETVIENCITSRTLGRRPVESINPHTGSTHLLDHPSGYESFVNQAASKAADYKKAKIQPHSIRNSDTGHDGITPS